MTNDSMARVKAIIAKSQQLRENSHTGKLSAIAQTRLAAMESAQRMQKAMGEAAASGGKEYGETVRDLNREGKEVVVVDSLQNILGGGIPSGQLPVLASRRLDAEPMEAERDADECAAPPGHPPSTLLSKLLTRVNPLPPLKFNIPERM